MVSDTAEADIEALIARGLKPTVRDIVRLNAVAIAFERGPDAAVWFALPRVAFLGDLTLYEPTVAHEIWMAKVQQVVDMDDDSDFACRLYVAAHAADRLVDPHCRDAVKAAVEANLAAFGAFTFRQVRAALEYVEFGAAPTAGESATPEPAKEGETLTEYEAVAIGVVNDAVAMRLGLSLADLGKMTRAQLMAVTRTALDVSRARGPARNLRKQTDYFRTLDEIADRLEKERQHGGS